MDKKFFGVGVALLLFCFLIGFMYKFIRAEFSKFANQSGARFMFSGKSGYLVPPSEYGYYDEDGEFHFYDDELDF